MRSSRRRIMSWICLALADLMLAGGSVGAKTAIPAPTSQFFVNDFAGVLSEQTESHIQETSESYSKANETQIVVTTIPSLDGESIEDYALAMGRQWGIGGEEENNGLLILLAVEDREIRIEVGYGLEGTITDGLSGRIIRGASDLLGKDDYDAGITQIYDDVVGELEEPGSYEEEHDDSVNWLAVILLVALFLLFAYGVSHRGRGGPGGTAGRRYRGYYGGPYGGGMSGGMSGGGFSGGGGSFGGGGASGKF